MVKKACRIISIDSRKKNRPSSNQNPAGKKGVQGSEATAEKNIKTDPIQLTLEEDENLFGIIIW